MTDQSRVVVYSVGPCYASACVERGTSREVVEAEVNRDQPTGVGPWRIAQESFADGAPNPHGCETDPGREHYLLQC
jgi:hypothetical protein